MLIHLDNTRQNNTEEIPVDECDDVLENREMYAGEYRQYIELVDKSKESTK